jgi:hypothetical protein
MPEEGATQAGAPEPTEPAAQDVTSDEPGSEGAEEVGTTVDIDGKDYPLKDVLEWRERGARRSQANKEDRRQIDLDRQKLEAERQAFETTKATATRPPADESSTSAYESLNEYVPGLGDLLKGQDQRLTDIQAAHTEDRKESAKVIEAAQYEDTMDEVLAPYEGQPYANLPQMKKEMEDLGMKPSANAAEAVYKILYGIPLGERIGEQNAKKRGVDAPASMKGGSLGIPQAAAADVPAATKPISETSWEEQRDKALADPRRAQFKT